MPSIESTFEKAVADRVIPGAVLAASSRDGSYKYVNSFGVSSLKDGTPMDPDAVLWLGSCTKLLTAIAALQCVERGHFTLDEDVTRLLPELKDIEVEIPGTDGGPPTRFKAKNTITLRRLLTHTSGLSYTRFGQLHLPLIDRCLSPLLFEPGEGWIYGTGHDFAGFMVERVTGLTLESYIREHIASPLGIDSFCFRLQSFPHLEARFARVGLRKGGIRGNPVQWTPDTVWPLDIQGESGGSGAYGTIVDYEKVMSNLLLLDDDDGKGEEETGKEKVPRLLSSKMMDELFAPDMKETTREGVMAVLRRNETTNNIYGGLPVGTQVTYAMGGMVVLEDLWTSSSTDGETTERRRRRPKGAMHWGALLNLFFWLDRENGLGGIYGSQVFPAGDPECLGLFAEFETKVYEGYWEGKKEGGREGSKE